MRTKLFTLLFLLSLGYTYSQGKYNVFENPSPLIEKLSFKTNGVYLKLTKKGIAYVQKDLNNNSEIIAKLVKKLHNEMVGGSSKFKIDCIASQVYWHCLFYDLEKSPNSKVDNYEVFRNSKYTKMFEKIKGYKPPKNTIKTEFGYLSNSRVGEMEIDYVELFVNGCRQGGKYVVPPNMIEKISKWMDKYSKLSK